MPSLRFVFSRRWVLFAITVAVIAYATWWLGEWQFGRLHDRKADNAIIRTNEALAPAPVDQVLAPGRAVRDDDEWRLITATGTYDVADTVVVRYQTMDGQSGVDIVVPLRTGSGASLLVNRGWLATGNEGNHPSDIPAPPSGKVTVTGYVRADGSGESTQVDDNSVRAISSVAIGAAQGSTTYGGFVDLASESPSPATALVPVELPELNNGPHFFYGLQWWFFGVLAVFGFFYLMYDEARGAKPGGAPAAPRSGGPFSRTPPTPAGTTSRAAPTVRPPKERRTNHPYARMRAEAAVREAEAHPGEGSDSV